MRQERKVGIWSVYVLGFLVLAYVLLFTTLLSWRYQVFFAESWEELAIINQMFWNIIHGNSPYSSISNTFFVKHFTPILFLAAIPYFLWPHIHTVFFILSITVALGSIPVFLLARNVFSSSAMGLYAAVLYLLLPSVHFLNLTDLRPILLSIPFLFWTFYFFYQKNFLMFHLFAVLSMMCNERVGLNIAFFAIYAIILRRDMKWILVPFLIGAGWFFIAVFFLLPRLGQDVWVSGFYINAYVQHLGVNSAMPTVDTVVYMLLHPLELFQRAFTGKMLEYMWRMSELPYFLPPYFAPASLLMAIPTYFQIMFQLDTLPTDCFHQTSQIIVFLVVAAVFGLKKIAAFLEKFGSRIIWPWVLVGLMSSIFVSNFGYNRYGRIKEPVSDTRFMSVRNVFDPIFYSPDDQDVIAWKLIRMIPPDASVAASGDLLPQLSERKILYEFGVDRGVFIETQSFQQQYFDVDYIFLRTTPMEHGGGGNNFDNNLSLRSAEALEKTGCFASIAREGDFILMKRVKVDCYPDRINQEHLPSGSW